MEAAPINIRVEPVGVSTWAAERTEWQALNLRAGGNPNFNPQTVKAGYVFGVIHEQCEAVQCLLHCGLSSEAAFLPGYGLCAAAVELLGRCINGNSAWWNPKDDLEVGLKSLVEPNQAPASTDVVITTSTASYSPPALVAMRHFSAHGQATADPAKLVIGVPFDFEIPEAIRRRLRDGLVRYWDALFNSDDPQLATNKLAAANVLRFRDGPVTKFWRILDGDPVGSHPSIQDVFDRFDFRFAPLRPIH